MVNDKYKILIVDDSQINRCILTDILSDNFEILEAGGGVEAIKMIKQYERQLSLILLDLVMPDMDGFEVLTAMNNARWIEDIPVIMISAENSPEYIEKAYDLGVTDFINRPFNVSIVQKRVANTIMLYDKQKNLVDLVTQQVFENEKNNNILINVLSHIVEFRNGESSLHVLRINIITEILLKRLVKKTDKYNLSRKDIANIVTASSLHDIGKITIPDHIINKPGRLTNDEFEIIKTHSKVGADMLASIEEYKNEPLVAAAHDICLYHHERYDGKGYPTGLAGEDIPISAQVVAVADVYDALTSVRCYKDAYSHEKAVDMIKNGECGALNPLILECLVEEGDAIRVALENNSTAKRHARQIKAIAEEMLNDDKFSTAKKSINMLEQSRIKYEFFASMSNEIQFEYTQTPNMISVSDWGAKLLGLPTVIVNPLEDKSLLDIFNGAENLLSFKQKLMNTSAENPVDSFDLKLKVDNELRWHKVQCMVFWSNDETPQIVSAIGKITDIDDFYKSRAVLVKKASLDSLTSLYNKGYSKEIITNHLELKDKKYALCLFDLDNFKSANDTYGHMFGDNVLKTVSSALLKTVRKDDIVSRIGGDEFMVFIEYKERDVLERISKRIFNALNGIVCDNYTVGISMGVTTTEDVGFDFVELFNSADTALYYSKRNGRGAINFYDSSMKLENNTRRKKNGFETML